MEKYITELLNNNVRVVLPDLGAFIVKQRKPLKIIFNEFLKYNDGLLIEFIAKSDNISKEDATKQVTEYVDSVKNKLNKNENVSVPGLGVLNKDQAGNIAFDLDKDTQIKTEPTIAKTEKKEKIKEEPKEEKKEEVKETKKAEVKKEEPKISPPPPPPPPKESVAAQQAQATKSSSESVTYTSGKYTKKSSDDDKKRIWLWLVAAAMAILIVVLILRINKTSFKDRDKEELVTQEAPAPVIEEEVKQPPEEEKIKVKEPAPVKPETIKPVMTSSGKRYYIIAGCFKVPGNADKYVIYLRKKGYPAEKLGIFNGYHVVSFNSFPTKKEALKELKVIRDDYEAEAWLKKY